MTTDADRLQLIEETDWEYELRMDADRRRLDFGGPLFEREPDVGHRFSCPCDSCHGNF